MVRTYSRETLGLHESWISAIALDSAGRFLASSAADETIRIWNIASGKERLRLQVPGAVVRCLQFGTDDRLLICGTGDPRSVEASIAGWDVETGEQLFRFAVEAWWVSSLLLQPGGSSLLLASHDGTLELLNLRTGQRDVVYLLQERSKIYAAAMTPDARYVGCAGDIPMIAIWDRVARHEIKRPHAYGETFSLAFHPKQDIVASGHYTSAIVLWDRRSLSVMQQLDAMPHESIFSLVFVSDGAFLIGASGDDHEKRGSVLVWSLNDQPAPIRLTDDGDQQMYVVVATADGSLIASGGSEGTLSIWRMQPVPG